MNPEDELKTITVKVKHPSDFDKIHAPRIHKTKPGQGKAAKARFNRKRRRKVRELCSRIGDNFQKGEDDRR